MIIGSLVEDHELYEASSTGLSEMEGGSTSNISNTLEFWNWYGILT